MAASRLALAGEAKRWSGGSAARLDVDTRSLALPSPTKKEKGVSFYVDCEDQTEVDEYWDKLMEAGAQPGQCGWIRVSFGLSWQIVPRRYDLACRR